MWVGQIIIVERNSGLGRFGLPLKMSFMFGVIIVVGLWGWVWNLAKVLLKSLGPPNPLLTFRPTFFWALFINLRPHNIPSPILPTL